LLVAVLQGGFHDPRIAVGPVIAATVRTITVLRSGRVLVSLSKWGKASAGSWTGPRHLASRGQPG
jgi:hypothetical protein